MKVILAGLSKTGTKTLNAALTLLGFKVYDVLEHFWYARKEWTALIDDTATAESLREIYKDVDAVCDVPASYYWEELLEIFPGAKVILMLRDDEDQWVRSFQKQLESINSFSVRMIYFLSLTGYRFHKFQNSMGIPIFSSAPIWPWTPLRTTPERAKSTYRRHNAHAMQNAPKDKLLVYNVKEGWAPLCKFLDVQEPDTPFPHKNIGGKIIEELMAQHPVFLRIKREMTVTFSLLAVGLAIGVYWIYTSL